MNTRGRDDKGDWTREVQPWPEGIRFGALDLPAPAVLKLPRPETHRPYGTSAAWAVGGGDA